MNIVEVTFAKDDLLFIAELNKRVDSYFKENKISKKCDKKMILKTVSLITLFIVFYILPYTIILPIEAYWLTQVFTGFFLILSALNIGHDAMHNAYSAKKKVNYWLGLIFNLSGTNAYIWNIMHNMHHKYPNIDGFDNDISHQNIVRMSPYLKHYWFHRYQHIYVFVAALFTTLDFLCYKDFSNFLSESIGNIKMPKHPIKEVIVLIFSKIVHFYLFLIQPILFLNYPIYIVITGFLLLHFVSGFILYFIFTPAHLTIDAQFNQPNINMTIIPESWTVHQLYTTCNYGNSFWTDLLFGGLNNQIEHHLFPAICHTHYPKLASIVESTAIEYNYPYIKYKTFLETIKMNLRYLYKIGNEKS